MLLSAPSMIKNPGRHTCTQSAKMSLRRLKSVLFDILVSNKTV